MPDPERGDGSGQGRVGAQFDEHRAAELGKGGLKPPAGRLGHRAEDLRGVGAGELRAVKAHQAAAQRKRRLDAGRARLVARARLPGWRQRLAKAWPDGVRLRRSR